MNLSSYLDAERKKHGWSMNELGRRAGVSGAQVANVIGERSDPGLDFCLAVARALNVDPVYLLRLAGHLPPAPGDTADPILSECWRILSQLTDDERTVVVRMLRGLVEGKG